MRCFRCNGTGLLCAICGETEGCCGCEVFDFYPCDDCKEPPKIKLPTLKTVEKKIGIKANDWRGRCYEIASLMIEKKLVKGIARYGHWLGSVAPGSSFFGRSATGFCRHGWIEAGEDLVIDPTRFEFEQVEPYIFYGYSKNLYDVGGNKFRRMMRAPIPKWSASDKQIPLPKDKRVLDFIVKTTGAKRLSVGQLFWIANLGPDEIGSACKPFYEWIVKDLKREALIPIDNLEMILGG